jgi:putative phosphoesterase
MRLGLIADIHADIRALESTLRWLDARGVKRIVCAGDLVGYGSQPDAVVDRIRDRNIPCIRGNHDRWALERRQVIGMRGWRPARFSDSTWAFLEALPAGEQLEIGGHAIAIHHGSPTSDTEFISPYKPIPASFDQFWDESEAQILILGHSHMVMVDRGPLGTIINPGSVLGVPGIQTSYSFAVVELDTLAVRIFDVRTGREIRRDPVFLDDE